MHVPFLRAACAAAVLLAAAEPPAADLVLEFDPENITAARLEGEWEPDPELAKRLFGSDKNTSLGRADAMIFKADPSILPKIPARMAKRIKEAMSSPVYLAGTMTLHGDVRPFLLVSFRGNPYIVYLRPKGKDPQGDGESFNVFVAAAARRENDLLLIGGEKARVPFTAYRRVKKGPE